MGSCFFVLSERNDPRSHTKPHEPIVPLRVFSWIVLTGAAISQDRTMPQLFGDAYSGLIIRVFLRLNDF